MARIYRKLTELIGNTPLLEVSNIERDEHLHARLLVKIESLNPGGSAKDRIALSMIEDAVRLGHLKPGGTIIEPTSGNTGVGLAWVGTSMGYKVILTMPDTMSVERRNLLGAYGAQLVLTPGNEGMRGAIAKAEQLQAEMPGSIILGQFSNPANPEVHRRTTGEEIWRDTDGDVDIFVASSPVLSGGQPGVHKIQGIGAGFVPRNYDAGVVDEVVTITDDDAMRGARMLARSEGLLTGISAGAALMAALREARKPENAGKTIVALLPDTGDRYLSTQLFSYDGYPL